MRSASVFIDENEEVTVSTNEVLEAHFAHLRTDVDELKTDFRELRADFHAAQLRIDNTIKAAVAKLEADIATMGAKAANDLESLAATMNARFAQVDVQLAEIRADNKEMRGKLDTLRDEVRDI